MSIDLAELAQDLASVLADLPTTFVDGSASMLCVASVIEASQQAKFGGIEGQARLRCVIPVGNFPNDYPGPTIGKVVSVNGADYRVFNANRDPHGLFVETILGEKFERR
jgi:hypothetical protein